MDIAIIGTRGIPNYYGGFEQFAEYLAKGLAERGHSITVYNSHSHPYKEPYWNNVKLIHCNDPEDKWGTAGQFIYDLNCIKHARIQKFDIILQLGYTSSSIWGWLLPRRTSIITTNMDGLEWKRSKYSRPVRWFLKRAEYLGTVFSDYWIADSIGIQTHLRETYSISSIYIPYGAFPFETPDAAALQPYTLTPFLYNMLVARLEPENNIDVILEGVSKSSQKSPFLVIGKHETTYGEYLKHKYAAYAHIQFIGGVYDITVLNNLRYYSNVYFHGHSVGGTNPSLLEAMASQALICAHNNVFNSAILGEDALYFSSSNDVAAILDSTKRIDFASFVLHNLNKIKSTYNWNMIIDQYEQHFKTIYSTKK